MFPPYGIGMGFQIINIMSILIFLLVFGMVIVGLIQTISQWHKNERSPRLTTEATVVTKCTAHRRTMSTSTIPAAATPIITPPSSSLPATGWSWN